MGLLLDLFSHVLGVVLDEPADWPEGCRVVITPKEGQRGEWLGITEEEWPRTPEALADWLKWLDSGA